MLAVIAIVVAIADIILLIIIRMNKFKNFFLLAGLFLGLIFWHWVLSAESPFNKPCSLAFNQQTGEIFVLNQRDGSIVVLEAGTAKILSTIKTNLKWPSKIAVNSKTNEIYIVSSSEDKVLALSPLQNNQEFSRAVIPVGRFPRRILINENTNKIYIANQFGRSVSVIDGVSKKIAATVELSGMVSDLALNNSKNQVYAFDNINSKLITIDGASNKIINSLEVCLGPNKLVFADSEGKIFVSCQTADSVGIVDANQRKLIKEIKTDPSPVGLAFNQSAKKLYILNARSKSVTIFDLKTGETKTLKLASGVFPERLAIDEERNKIFISADGSNQILIIDGQTDQIVKTFEIGGQVLDLIFDPKSGKLYGTNSEADNVFVIDTKNDDYSVIGPYVDAEKQAEKRVIYGPTVLLARSSDEFSLYVANVLSQSIAVFDKDLNLKIKVPLEVSYPQSKIDFSPKAGIVFSGNNKMLVLSSKQDKKLEVKQVDIASPIIDFDLVDSLNKGFVLIEGGMLQVFDLEKWEIIKSLPLGFEPMVMNFGLQAKKIYLTDIKKNKIIVLDSSNYSVVKEISLAAPSGAGPNKESFYVVNFLEKKIFLIDTQTDEKIKEWQIEFRPSGFASDERHGKLYILDKFQGISVVDLATDKITTLPNAVNPFSLFISPRLSRLYVTDTSNGTVLVFDTANDSLLASLQAGSYPVRVAVEPESGRLYVANFWGNSISVFDKDLKPEATILSNGSVIWQPGKGPTVAEKNIVEKAWQWIISHKKESGAILAGIVLLALGFIIWRRKNKINPAV